MVSSFLTSGSQLGRSSLAMTYEEAARRFGISTTSAHRKLNGDQRIELDELELFARILGVKVSVQLKEVG